MQCYTWWNSERVLASPWVSLKCLIWCACGQSKLDLHWSTNLAGNIRTKQAQINYLCKIQYDRILFVVKMTFLILIEVMEKTCFFLEKRKEEGKIAFSLDSIQCQRKAEKGRIKLSIDTDCRIAFIENISKLKSSFRRFEDTRTESHTLPQKRNWSIRFLDPDAPHVIDYLTLPIYQRRTMEGFICVQFRYFLCETQRGSFCTHLCILLVWWSRECKICSQSVQQFLCCHHCYFQEIKIESFVTRCLADKHSGRCLSARFDFLIKFSILVQHLSLGHWGNNEWKFGSLELFLFYRQYKD